MKSKMRESQQLSKYEQASSSNRILSTILFHISYFSSIYEIQNDDVFSICLRSQLVCKHFRFVYLHCRDLFVYLGF